MTATDADIGPPGFCPIDVDLSIGNLGGRNTVRVDEIAAAETGMEGTFVEGSGVRVQ